MNQMEDNINIRLDSKDWNFQIAQKVINYRKRYQLHCFCIVCLICICFSCSFLLFTYYDDYEESPYAQLSNYLVEPEYYDFDVVDVLADNRYEFLK